MHKKTSYARTSRLISYFRNHVIALEVICTLVIIFVGMRSIHLFEGFSIYNSFYYVIITIAGVGYGDITPITPQGKMVAMIIASLGMPLYLITATIIATNVVNGMKKTKKTREKVIISKVKALIVEDKKILFLKIDRESYTVRDLPGGTIHYGEEVENALSRRVMQETHRSIIINKSVGIWRRMNKYTGTVSLCHTYLAHLKTINGNGNTDEYKELEIVRIPIQDIIDNIVDIENDSLTELIKNQCKHLAT